MTPVLNNTFGLKVIKESSSNGKTIKIKLQGKCQEADAPNNNGRKYYLRTLNDKIINARCTPAMLAAQPLFGEVIHPSDELNGEINAEKIVWKINWVKMVGTTMYCEVELINKGICGEMMFYLVDECGAVPGISSRAFGALNDDDYIDHDSYLFVTFDATFNPSTANAFLSRISESSNIKELLGRCDSKQIKAINESFNVDVAKLVPLRESFKPDLNNMSEQTPQSINESKIVDLSTQLGTAKAQVTTLTESNSVQAAEIKTLKESLAKVQGFYTKALQVGDGLTKKLKESKEANGKLLSQYNKAVAVAEGLHVELNERSKHYGKALRVIESTQTSSLKAGIVKLVESVLGKDSYKKYEVIFSRCLNLNEAKQIINTLKPAGARPTDSNLRGKANESGTPGKVAPANQGGAPKDQAFQSRVNMYS